MYTSSSNGRSLLERSDLFMLVWNQYTHMFKPAHPQDVYLGDMENAALLDCACQYSTGIWVEFASH